MPKFVSVLSHKGSDVVVTVSAALAESNGLEVVDQPATDANGVPLTPRRRNGRPVKPHTSVDGEAKKKSNGDEPATISKP